MQILDASKKGEKEEDKEEEVSMDTVGCTANVIYFDQEKKKLFVVNAGDSRCTMGKAGKAVEMSKDHKPED